MYHLIMRYPKLDLPGWRGTGYGESTLSYNAHVGHRSWNLLLMFFFMIYKSLTIPSMHARASNSHYPFSVTFFGSPADREVIQGNFKCMHACIRKDLHVSQDFEGHLFYLHSHRI